MRTLLTFLFFNLLLLMGLDGVGQTKKPLTVDDYKRWDYFYQYSLSTNAKWITFIMRNPRGKDTLFLRKTTDASRYIIVGAKQGRFSPQSNRFFCLRDNVLIHQELASGKRDSIDGIDSYHFSKGGAFLIAEGKKKEKEKELKLILLATNKTRVISAVVEYVLSPDSTKIGIIQRKGKINTVRIINLTKSLNEIELAQSAEKLSGLTWNMKGSGLAFFEQLPLLNKNHLQYQVHYITFRNKYLQDSLKKEVTSPLPSDYFAPISKLFFSSDDEQLFFDVHPVLEKDKVAKNVIVWSSSAKILPPPNENNSKLLLMCWHVKTNHFSLVNDAIDSIGIPTATGKNALIVNTTSYLPHFKYGGIYADLYIKNLQTGHKKLIAQKINYQKNYISISPHGKHITWFTNKNWWLYDIEQNKTRCLTCSTHTNFENPEHDYPGDKYPNDKPYWTRDDKIIILTDFYDVWQFTSDGKIKKRITNGKTKKSKFRINDKEPYFASRDHFFSFLTRSIDLKNGLLLKETNTETLNEGFSFYKSDKSLQSIQYTDDRINAISKVGDTFMYVLSDFDKSPELVIQKLNKKETQTIQYSNKHQKEFYWGKSKLIHYKVKDVSLKGALFYPAGYQPGKSYPMIVKIYQQASSNLRKYEPPSIESGIGFNVTNFTAAGYFVLYPDIHYTLNKTGESALKCVLAGVDKAIQTACIDSTKIGLFGHSFGGFEVSYIITQTHRFKTAVAGSGWHDLVGTYLGTDDFDTSSMWRFDTQQLRMSESYYTKAFSDNSPIMHAHNIQTPLLLWAGTNDTRINWNNSSKLQMALWRLGKKSTLIVYPNEEHNLSELNNKIDLNTKTLSWYNYYLKNEEKPSWIN